ncbi:non-ribosomal peptide synthetase, partial [Streptomyces qinglanensis]|uniref:non-ribosomal peptide synthetase n=1 Tax=Streptomyces qinglanensis TaxID=943816 RepID=UPI001112CC03
MSVLWLTAPLFNQHLRECPDLVAGLRTVMYGGEAVDRSVADELMAGPWAPEQLFHAYGPTETTVFAATYRVRPDGPVTAQMPIGGPIANTELLVMDGGGGLCPLGAPGELWIGGPGVARGYWARPGLTAERFVPHPFSVEPGARVYRTGDLVRWRGGGDLEFLGRIDDQVKVRGLRIELGEIESVLVGHAGVASAVVMVREDGPGGKYLTAYCVPASAGGVLDEADVLAWCRAGLPSYMVPGALVVLDALPLTPNGKVAKKQLPAPEVSGSRGVYVAPRTGTEKAIARVWQEVLHLDQVGIHDNFFDLGGHSLMATAATNRIAEALRTDLPVRVLFEAPTVAELAVHLDGRSDLVPPLKPRAGEEPAPLSFAQRRLWFLDQLEPDSAEYVIPFGFRVRGSLDTAALETAFTGLVERHEALRTRFVVDATGEPRQVVDEAGPVHVTRWDVRNLDGASERADRARTLADTEALRPFKLDEGALVRVLLIQLADDDYQLLVTMHHIVSDGWSVGIVTEELRELYAAALEGRQPALPAVPVQYADFAQWQGEVLTEERVGNHLDFWRDKLAGLEPQAMPTDWPRPHTPSRTGASRDFSVPADLVFGLRTLASEHGASLYMVVLAAFQVLLSRWSGQHDVCVGSPVAGRNRPEVERVIGVFVNTLPMRADLSGDPTFHELLGQVRETAMQAYAHQDLPLERLVEEVAPERDMSRNPLFQSVLALQNVPGGPWSLPGVEVTPIEVQEAIPSFDLVFFLEEGQKGELRGRALYAVDLFEEATVTRLTEHFCAVLRSVCENPHTSVASIPLGSVLERRRLLTEFNDTRAPFSDGTTVSELVEARAAQAPDAVAVVSGQDRMTYAQMNARANQLAHHLRERGIGRGEWVPVCLPPGPELVVTLLGALKAGAAYVCLHPDYPRQRLEFMVRDMSARLILTEARLRDRLVGLCEELLLVDEDWARIAEGSAQHAQNPRPRAGAGDLMHMVYTSGSTGTPKGVMIEHRSVCRLIGSTPFNGLTPADNVTMHSNPSWDALTLEVWPTLAAGATLVVLPADSVLHAERLRSTVRNAGVSVLWLTAPLFNQHLRECPDLVAGLRTVMYGGEAVDRSVADELMAGPWAPEQLFHAYGPTETTVFAATYRVRPDGPVTAQMPIGGPIANTELLVMDGGGGLCPLGAPGELWIGGPGVARGYWARPGLTAERFVPHPFSVEPGARVYRTGDLVRWRGGGDLEFLGRIDDQVKVRGLRIELGEIESVLVGHAGVASAVVMVREDGPGGKYLTAYCVPASAGGVLDEADVLAWCRAGLPSYMVPGALVVLDALPLTPNGKVAKKQLPAPEVSGSRGVYVAPRTGTEKAIARVWQEVLHLDQVGIHDNFFDLGGHSL